MQTYLVNINGHKSAKAQNSQSGHGNILRCLWTLIVKCFVDFSAKLCGMDKHKKFRFAGYYFWQVCFMDLHSRAKYWSDQAGLLKLFIELYFAFLWLEKAFEGIKNVLCGFHTFRSYLILIVILKDMNR